MADMAENPQNYGSSTLPSLDSCLGCRRCEAVCPAGVAYDSLLIESRAAVPPDLGWREKAVLKLLATKPILNGALGTYQKAYPILPKSLKPLPRPPGFAAKKTATGSVALFTGCIADSYEDKTRSALLRLLAAAGITATVPERQVCCGQAALHAGQHETADRLSESNREVLQPYEHLLVLASGCFSALQNRIGIPVEDAGVFLAQFADRLSFKSAEGLRVALHIPCTALANGSDQVITELLAKIPDLEVIQLPDSGCCGAAGLHQISQPERARQLRAPILDSIAANKTDIVLSSNIGCRLHLSDGLPIDIQHPMEFMAQFLNDI
jgi:glycolate oxidase iron-sulfur subunit